MSGLALVGHLGAVDGDAVDDDADGLAQCLGGVVLVPDDAAVELARSRVLRRRERMLSQTVAVEEAVALAVSIMTISLVDPPGPCAPSWCPPSSRARSGSTWP